MSYFSQIAREVNNVDAVTHSHGINDYSRLASSSQTGDVNSVNGSPLGTPQINTKNGVKIEPSIHARNYWGSSLPTVSQRLINTCDHDPVEQPQRQSSAPSLPNNNHPPVTTPIDSSASTASLTSQHGLRGSPLIESTNTEPMGVTQPQKSNIRPILQTGRNASSYPTGQHIRFNLGAVNSNARNTQISQNSSSIPPMRSNTAGIADMQSTQLTSTTSSAQPPPLPPHLEFPNRNLALSTTIPLQVPPKPPAYLPTNAFENVFENTDNGETSQQQRSTSANVLVNVPNAPTAPSGNGNNTTNENTNNNSNTNSTVVLTTQPTVAATGNITEVSSSNTLSPAGNNNNASITPPTNNDNPIQSTLAAVPQGNNVSSSNDNTPPVAPVVSQTTATVQLPAAPTGVQPPAAPTTVQPPAVPTTVQLPAAPPTIPPLVVPNLAAQSNSSSTTTPTLAAAPVPRAVQFNTSESTPAPQRNDTPASRTAAAQPASTPASSAEKKDASQGAGLINTAKFIGVFACLGAIACFGLMWYYVNNNVEEPLKSAFLANYAFIAIPSLLVAFLSIPFTDAMYHRFRIFNNPKKGVFILVAWYLSIGTYIIADPVFNMASKKKGDTIEQNLYFIMIGSAAALGVASVLGGIAGIIAPDVDVVHKSSGGTSISGRGSGRVGGPNHIVL